MNNKRNALVVFAKPPVPGMAKTRLISALGANGAAQLHEELCLHLLNQAVNPNYWNTYLFCASQISHSFFEQCQRQFSIPLISQKGDDLGERMYNAFIRMKSEYDNVVIVGTDCPAIDDEVIATAFESLKDKSVFISPAEDGGYVLIGLSNVRREIFSNVEWGSEKVFEQTMQKIEREALSYAKGPVLWDVDVPEDLHRLKKTFPQMLVNANQALANV